MLKISVLLFLASTPVFIVNGKVMFSKDLSVNGTLYANEGAFKKLEVKELCNVDELLSAD